MCELYRIRARFIVDGFTLGRSCWLVGETMEDLAMGSIYDNGDSFTIKQLEDILTSPNIGKTFIVEKIERCEVRL